VGIKDATGDLRRGRELIAAAPEGFAVYSGDDATAMQLMLAGAHGNISVTANLLPERLAALCAAALAGDRSRAEALDAELAQINRALFIEANPMPLKYALARIGRIEPGIRLPLTEISAESAAVVDQALQELSL
jgi:4-hydroxy-tetrahydrodipicolinate synthase